jgi:hypothetical protein
MKIMGLLSGLEVALPALIGSFILFSGAVPGGGASSKGVLLRYLRRRPFVVTSHNPSVSQCFEWLRLAMLLVFGPFY